MEMWNDDPTRSSDTIPTVTADHGARGYFALMTGTYDMRDASMMAQVMRHALAARTASRPHSGLHRQENSGMPAASASQHTARCTVVSARRDAAHTASHTDAGVWMQGWANGRGPQSDIIHHETRKICLPRRLM